MLQMRLMRRTKSAVLAAMAIVGGTLFASCGMIDIRQGFVAGTQTFLQAYTADLLASLVPPASDLLGTVSGG